MEQLERYRGALLGLAVGDALGAPLEGLPPGSFTPVKDMMGGGFRDLEPRRWTHDTSMALCLAETFKERRSFGPDQWPRCLPTLRLIFENSRSGL